MIRKSAILLCVFLGVGALAGAQQPAAPGEMPCATLLFMIHEKDPGTLPDVPTAYQMAVLTSTIKLLSSRLGGEVVRARLGITVKSESDPLWYGETVVSTRALLLYDRQYCVEHPLNTLSDAVDNVVRQVQARK